MLLDCKSPRQVIMTTLPNLAGVASKDLVESIGNGRFQASYINWSRTMNLLRTHAPGWLVDYVPAEDGSLLHKAPVGAYLLIRFQNLETGVVTPALPQAVMDHRNNAIPFEKITARDVTDTQRRGMCMAAAMHFGLAYELWAKMPLESGYSAPESAPESAPKAQVSAPPAAEKALTAEKAAPPTGGTSEATQETFREACIECGLTTYACDGLLDRIKGDYAGGVATLKKKSKEDIDKINEEYKKW